MTFVVFQDKQEPKERKETAGIKGREETGGRSERRENLAPAPEEEATERRFEN